ncbi:alpha/beta hydrolase [Azospirillum sp.]|uniref:alpha/beta hydrolase n=1 Tax=Azospirillum sp. TaxID=34012 RepID=UPI002D590B46|nr:alpha/beta hydrolase [Azospirillum sp.]HYD66206.1 alpha/beta hydrolase [Azospirillum sp.]
MLKTALDGASEVSVAPSSLLDPQVQRLLAAAKRQGASAADPLQQPLAVARMAAERHYTFLNGPLPALARVDDVVIEGPAGPLPLRIHRPATTGALPVLLWFHGGGFVLNSLDTHDRLLRLLARRSGAAVVGVAYSKAPERRFPTQVEEAAAALRWLTDHGAAHGLDAGRLAVGGDSAGANLALTAALEARDGGPRIALGVLLYGMFAANFDTDSHRCFGDGRYGLSTARMRWYWRQYLGTAAGGDARAEPLLADLGGLPPLLLVGAGVDCLLDDTLRLAERLAEADVPHRLWVYPDLPHSFAQMARAVDAADTAVTRIAAAVAEALAGVEDTPCPHAGGGPVIV